MKKLNYVFVGFALIGSMMFSCKKETTTSTTTNPTTTTLDTTKTISYKNDIAPLMSQECTSCHNNANTSAGVNLSSFANVSKFASSSISAINAGIMPPSGKWSADKIVVFSKWIAQGKLNN